MIAGSQDHVGPPRIGKANVKAYRHSTAVTAYREFQDRTHFIIGQSGWQEVANYSLDWALDQQLLTEREQRRIARQSLARQVA